MRIILLGAPGSGKGSQARLLAARLDVAETGDVASVAVRVTDAVDRSRHDRVT